MCTQGTKEFIESVAHSTVIQSTCAPGTLKTIPVHQESVLRTISITVSPPAGFTGHHPRRPIDMSCPHRGSKPAALHTHKSMLPLPSPSYTFNDSPLILSDAPDVGFIPLHWAQCICHQQIFTSLLLATIRTASQCFKKLSRFSGSSQEIFYLYQQMRISLCKTLYFSFFFFASQAYALLVLTPAYTVWMERKAKRLSEDALFSVLHKIQIK